MRLMSCTLTTEQVIRRTKTVTRRLGWSLLRAGDLLCLCEKCMGRKAGAPLVRLAVVRVVSATQEPLISIEPDDVAAEGFPDLSPSEFVYMFCRHMGCRPATLVTRIEWRYLPGGNF